MTSDKQKAANRQNAKRSTGPRSVNGRAASSRNAVTHGFFSREAVLHPGEDFFEYESFRRAIRADSAPIGAVEELLVDKVVAAAWRIKRLYWLESRLFHLELPALPELYSFAKVKAILAESMSNISDDALAQARSLDPVDEQIGEAAAKMDSAILAYARRDDAFSKLPYYETHLERAFYQAIHELQRVQAARKGRSDRPPS